jgi:hypothetical protein
MGSYEDRLGRVAPEARGRLERRKKNLEAQMGHSWGSKVNVEAPSVRKMDLRRAWAAGREQVQRADRVCPLVLRLWRVVEEKIAQD